MTFEQARVHCCENILRNLIRITKEYKLRGDQLERINKHIGGEVLDYIQKKYPLTQSKSVNRALEKELT